MASLLDPIDLGAIHAPNRILMSPLTRTRATREHIATPLMVEYYRQRASAGLIISEGLGISKEGLSWPFTPGIWSEEQVESWKRVTEAVHEAGGRIVAQLWHMGRVAHPSVHGIQPVSASPTTAPGQTHTYDGKADYVEARPLELDEIPRLLDDYENAARQALAAGFDGIKLHSANGYLIDQFLRDSSNHREDAYGGSIENRIRLLGEVVERLVSVAGANRTGVRLSPNGDSQGVDDSDPIPLFNAVGAMLDKFGLAFLELREPLGNGVDPLSPHIRKVFSGPLVLNSDYTVERAKAAMQEGIADAISFGRLFIANPDLPRRIAEGLPLNELNVEGIYAQTDQGYIDYPTASVEV